MNHPYEDAVRQFHAPRPDVLIDTVLGIQAKALFRVPVPDSRLRVKVAVFFSPVPSSITSGGLPIDIRSQWPSTIWLGLEEIDFAGRIAGPVPVQNLIVNPTTGLLVTRAAPLTIPSDANVMGYSQEFQTGGDQIVGELVTTFSAPQNQNGRWMLYTRYQPDGLSMPPDEWESVKKFCTPRVVSTTGATGGGNT
jgi:hypothetical protein